MKNQWLFVNRCLICGTRLVFIRSDRKDAKPEEGMKICDRNHGRFSVVGFYNAQGEWETDLYFPKVGSRWET